MIDENNKRNVKVILHQLDDFDKAAVIAAEQGRIDAERKKQADFLAQKQRIISNYGKKNADAFFKQVNLLRNFIKLVVEIIELLFVVFYIFFNFYMRIFAQRYAFSCKVVRVELKNYCFLSKNFVSSQKR